MVDYTYIQDGDLDDAAAVTTLVGHGNLSDYAGYGLDITADLSTSPGTYSVSEGKVFCLLDTQHASGANRTVHDCLIATHYEPRTGLALADTGVNYIWAIINISTDDSPHFDATTSATPPSDDAVLIGEIDTTAADADAAVTELNRDPDGNYEDLTAEHFWINNSITWPDGVTTDTHPLVYGERIDNPNDYYDSDAADPPGVVQQAERATRADSANTADSAAFATDADDSAHLEGYTLDEVLSFAEELRAQPWEPLFDQPYVDDSYEERPYVSFDVSDQTYDRYRVRLHVENDMDYSAGLGCYINGITDNVYNMINLLPRDEHGNKVSQRTGSDTWTVGSTMAKGHSLHEFYVALPEPIVSGGPRRRFPLFNAGVQHTAGIGSYQLSGVLTKSVKRINEVLIETGGKRLAIKAQIYGQSFFPDEGT